MDDIELAKKWLHAKKMEDEFKKARVEIEKEILQSGEILNKKDGDVGTFNFHNILSIGFGKDRKWDQEKLLELYKSDQDPFPFKIEFKEDRKLSSALEEMADDYWNSTFEPLLTEKPKKASFKVR